ncbi:hypothetical protein KFL_006670070 [Klebsormidium nitens]|uniref:BED-type domain-containing protein n=1 Tax=Klebsormidium nitens TaxID=105231 RepID=A0A0U9HKN3_KLENI|nr:hypothetical protein KFL_006670070 [Klebsormidium nitens]|eukprot:GAQ90649.1 hypothetical protein KFL_006670070 [Klebsormidium nitens]
MASPGSDGAGAATAGVSGASQQSTMTSFLKKRPGRPKGEVWEHFEKISGPDASKRHVVRCNHCNKESTGRVEQMVIHIANECGKAPTEERMKMLEKLGAKADAADENPAKKQKGSTGVQQRINYHVDTSKVTAAQKKALDLKLLLLFVMCGIPFMVASSPWFLDFVHALRPNYNPAGDYALRTSLLLQEAARVECFMHAFALFIGSILGHQWAAPLISDAQRVVTHFRASHRCLALLNKLAKALGISRGLQTSNKTRFTSVHNCLQSVVENERALQAVVQQHPEVFTAPRNGTSNPKTIIQDRLLWPKLEALCNLLEPYSQVITAIQSRNATIADVARYFLYLGQQVKKVQANELLPLDFKNHCVLTFNKRFKEMDHPILHLALFLHPYYKAAADQRSQFLTISTTAVELWKNYGHSPAEVKQLMHEMVMYKAGEGPFGLVIAPETFDLRLWWQTVRNKQYNTLAALALIIADIVPHAGDIERVFSMMGWMQNDKRNRLGTGTLELMAKVKVFHQVQKPR